MRFPNEYNSKEERVQKWLDEINTFIRNPKLVNLMKAFGFNSDLNASFEVYLNEVHCFTRDHWDFRNGERSSVTDKDINVTNSRELIIETAKELELIKTKNSNTEGQFDYTLPLGGFRAATYDRIEWARRYKHKGIVVALTGHRNIEQIEIPFLSFVPEEIIDNCTEYLTACYSVEDVFGVSNYTEEVDTSLPGGLIVRDYGHEYHVICAPTPPGKKRANTAETVECFKQAFSPKERASLLCITSPIYSSYQMATLARLSIDNDLLLFFDFCGEIGKINPTLTNYLQEIKGTIDAFVEFYDSVDDLV